MDLLHSILSQYDREIVALFVTCAWLIWYAHNKLRHDGVCTSEDLIMQQALLQFEEFLKFHHQVDPVICGLAFVPSRKIWKPLDRSTPKVNADFGFLESKIGIGILVCNHLGIPLVAEALPRIGKFSISM